MGDERVDAIRTYNENGHGGLLLLHEK
jgi:hypothetical protein